MRGKRWKRRRKFSLSVGGKVLLVALAFLAPTVGLMGFSFYRLSSPGLTPSTDAPAESGEVVLHLRDMVAGTLWLTTQPDAGLSAAQSSTLDHLLPEVRRNMEGDPTLIDPDLERRFARLLSPQQLRAMEKWVQEQKDRPDYMTSLDKLEQAVKQ